MSAGVMHFEGRPGVLPGMPEPTDLADLWLAHSLSWLLDACEVPVAERRVPVRFGDLAVGRGAGAGGEDAHRRLERLDAARLAVLFAALAVEARLDRLLRQRDATDWPAVAHLAPAEKFRIAPRLLDGNESVKIDRGLCNLAEELFALRDELVDAVGCPGAALTTIAPGFSPSRTRTMVRASATICDVLAILAHEVKGSTPRLVWEAADALTRRAQAVSALGSLEPELERGWNVDIDFPPDIAAS